MNLLPINTRIRLINNPEITGTIIEHIVYSNGELSLLPYKVNWDDHLRAMGIIGFLVSYPSPRYIEEVK